MNIDGAIETAKAILHDKLTWMRLEVEEYQQTARPPHIRKIFSRIRQYEQLIDATHFTREERHVLAQILSAEADKYKLDERIMTTYPEHVTGQIRANVSIREVCLEAAAILRRTKWQQSEKSNGTALVRMTESQPVMGLR